MSVNCGVVAFLQAKPGKEDDLEKFLLGGREIVLDEPGTKTWYAFKLGDGRFGIFDSFSTEADRQAHLEGRIPAGLAEHGADLLGADPEINTVDIIAVK